MRAGHIQPFHVIQGSVRAICIPVHTRALRKFAILPFDLHHLPLFQEQEEEEEPGRLVSALPRFTEMKSFLDRGGHPLNIARDPGGDESGSFSRRVGGKDRNYRCSTIPPIRHECWTYLEVFGVIIIVVQVIETDIFRGCIPFKRMNLLIEIRFLIRDKINVECNDR